MDLHNWIKKIQNKFYCSYVSKPIENFTKAEMQNKVVSELIDYLIGYFNANQ